MIVDSLTKALPRPAGVRHRGEMGLRPGSLSNVSTSGSVRIDGLHVRRRPTTYHEAVKESISVVMKSISIPDTFSILLPI